MALRRLLYCGEWIHSHVLHIYLLHAPDFLGYPDAIELAKDRREFVERGLALKKAGNRLMEQLGGRAIHPINVRLGGFYSVPSRDELKPLAEMLRRAMDDALYTVRAVAEFDFPDTEFDHELLALTHPDRYAIENGAISRSAGSAFAVADFLDHVVESQVPHSTALHATLDGASPPDRTAGAVLAELGCAVTDRAASGGGGRPWQRVPKSFPQYRCSSGRGGLRD